MWNICLKCGQQTSQAPYIYIYIYIYDSYLQTINTENMFMYIRTMQCNIHPSHPCAEGHLQWSESCSRASHDLKLPMTESGPQSIPIRLFVIKIQLPSAIADAESGMLSGHKISNCSCNDGSDPISFSEHSMIFPTMQAHGVWNSQCSLILEFIGCCLLQRLAGGQARCRADSGTIGERGASWTTETTTTHYMSNEGNTICDCSACATRKLAESGLCCSAHLCMQCDHWSCLGRVVESTCGLLIGISSAHKDLLGSARVSAQDDPPR